MLSAASFYQCSFHSKVHDHVSADHDQVTRPERKPLRHSAASETRIPSTTPTAWTPSNCSCRFRAAPVSSAAKATAPAPRRCLLSSCKAPFAPLDQTTRPGRSTAGLSVGTRTLRSGSKPPGPSRGAIKLRSSSSPQGSEGDACRTTAIRNVSALRRTSQRMTAPRELQHGGLAYHLLLPLPERHLVCPCVLLGRSERPSIGLSARATRWVRPYRWLRACAREAWQ